MMKLTYAAVAVSVVFSLGACSTAIQNDAPLSNSATPANQQSVLYKHLQSWLPGFYSDYTQVSEAGGTENSVTDLTVRQLPTQSEPVFLFESMPRHSTLASYTLYFVKQHAVSGQPELHFSRLTGSELSMSMTDTLDTAWKRVVPGCVITLSAAADKLSGASLSETCTFEDPLHGKTMLERSLAITDQQIEFSNRLLQPGETVDSSPAVMKFHKHQTFEGSVNVATANLSHGKGQAGWQELTTFNIFDDGRTIQLYDADMNSVDYALRLSRLHWRENEPPYLKLEIINLVSGGTQAFSWFNPESKEIDWELDWLKIHLKRLNLNME